MSFILNTMQNMSKKNRKLQVCNWWVAWNARNHFLFKGKKSNHLLSFARAEAAIDYFKRVKLKDQVQIEKPTENSQRRPPLSGECRSSGSCRSSKQREG